MLPLGKLGDRPVDATDPTIGMYYMLISRHMLISRRVGHDTDGGGSVASADPVNVTSWLQDGYGDRGC